jgi:hypothetical protein
LFFNAYEKSQASPMKQSNDWREFCVSDWFIASFLVYKYFDDSLFVEVISLKEMASF